MRMSTIDDGSFWSPRSLQDGLECSETLPGAVCTRVPRSVSPTHNSSGDGCGSSMLSPQRGGREQAHPGARAVRASPIGDGKVGRAFTQRRQVRPARHTSSMTKNYLEAAIEIAQEAGKILREEFDRPPHIVYKGDADLVTQADKRSERAIVERLTKYFPDHAIAAEEGSGHESSSEFRWHVDPLDGTTNFAHGYPCFCVSIALAQRDTLLAAAIYNPISDEMFSAAQGQGATLNGHTIH